MKQKLINQALVKKYLSFIIGVLFDFLGI
jgi:hypothetical protein